MYEAGVLSMTFVIYHVLMAFFALLGIGKLSSLEQTKGLLSHWDLKLEGAPIQPSTAEKSTTI